MRNKFKTMLKDHNENLKIAVDNNFGIKNVCIFGAGSYGQKIASILTKNEVIVHNFFDNDLSKHNSKINNISIYHPTKKTKELSKYPIIIGSTWHQEILTQLTNMSPNIVVLNKMEFDYDLIQYYLTNEDIEDLMWLYDNLENQESREVLINLLHYRSSGVFANLPTSSYPQYYHPELDLQWNEVIIDAGAWQGDTALFFLKHLSASQVISFEPDPYNYSILKTLKNKYTERHIPLQYGLWDTKTTLYFSSTDIMGEQKSIGCLIHEKGDIQIDTESVDNIIEELGVIPTFIKMDIEGAEINAILGSKKTILKYKPKLAICIYHKPDDLWKIPKLIHSIREDYKFSIGHHFKGWTESVLYAY